LTQEIRKRERERGNQSLKMTDEELQKRVRFSDAEAGGPAATPEPSSHERIKSNDKYLRQLYFQWHLSLGNYSKLRKRQNSTNSDAEVMDTADPNCLKEIQTCDGSEFDEYKPSVWRKTFRSVLLRLRGQEQHKDVYVIPSHLREQLKQTYVY